MHTHAHSISSPTPADFAEPGVLHLGEYTGAGGLDAAVESVILIQRRLGASFRVKAVQFSFNETPALVRVDSTTTDVLTDWVGRRSAYQEACAAQVSAAACAATAIDTP